MAFNLSGGYGAGGAADGLREVIEQRLLQAKLEELKRSNLAEEGLRQQQIDQAGELTRAQMAQGDRQFGERLGLDREKFGEDRRQFDSGQAEGTRRFDTEMGFKKGEAVREQGNADRSFGLNEKVFGETSRHNRASEGIAAQNAQSRDRLVQVMGPDGKVIYVREDDAVGSQAPPKGGTKAVTGAERQTLAYYNRAKEAVDTLTAQGPKGQSLEDRISRQGTVSQLWGKAAPSLLQSGDQQAYQQAQRAFTEARLRKESGAAIPPAEFENDARTYFAQPGDKPETIAQKRKMRQTVLEGLKYSAGKAVDEYYGEQQPSGAPASGSSSFDFDPSTGKLVPRKP